MSVEDSRTYDWFPQLELGAEVVIQPGPEALDD